MGLRQVFITCTPTMPTVLIYAGLVEIIKSHTYKYHSSIPCTDLLNFSLLLSLSPAIV